MTADEQRLSDALNQIDSSNASSQASITTIQTIISNATTPAQTAAFADQAQAGATAAAKVASDLQAIANPPTAPTTTAKQ